MEHFPNNENVLENHQYHLLLGQLSKEKARSLIEKGIYSGKPLNGYQKSRGSNIHIVDEAKRPLIQEIFRCATKKKTSVRKLQATCTSIGLTGTSGQPISLNSLHLMLTNPFYAGIIRSAAGLIAGQHEAIISKAKYNAVQINLRGRRC